MSKIISSKVRIALMVLFLLVTGLNIGSMNMSNMVDFVFASPSNTNSTNELVIMALEDAFVSDYYPDDNFNTTQLRVGVEGLWPTEKVERSFLKFNLTPLRDYCVDINGPDDVNITDAELLLYKVGGNSVTEISVYNTTNSWSETSITWNNQPSYEENDLISSNYVLVTPGYYSFNITSFIKQICYGSDWNNDVFVSLMLKSNNESVYNNYKIFFSREIEDYEPKIVVTTIAEIPGELPSVSDLIIDYDYEANNGSVVLKWSYDLPYTQFEVFTSETPELSSFDLSTPIAIVTEPINGETDLFEWHDYNALDYESRFYIVRPVLDSVVGNTSRIVGKITKHLDEGWNIIGLPLNLTHKELGAFSEFSDPLPVVPECVDRVFRFVDGVFEFTTFYPGYGYYASGSSSDFTTLDPRFGYYVLTNQSCDLTLFGTLPETIQVQLNEGWNLISFYSAKQKPIGAFSEFSDPLPVVPECVDRVFRFVDGVFEFTTFYPGYGYYASGSSSDFTTLDPGFGYWILTNQSCTLTMENE